MISRNDPCWCGSNKKFKKCHYPQLKNNSEAPKNYLKSYGIIIKNKKQVEGIKRACKIAAKILDKLCKAAKTGVTTLELDNLANDLHKKYDVIPAPLNYGSPPFPKSICTSLNDVVCHGIPDKTKLKDGDILNIDVTCILDGYYGDTSRMVIIGEVSEEKKKVVATSYQCLMESIKILKPGIKIFEIANVIEKIAKEKDCSVVNQFVGHGVGIGFHEPPQIPHSYNDIQIPLVPAMTFTIEPMINAGLRECAVDPEDKWTAKTIDSEPSAQFEHTILITENSHEILTLL
ncbi:MAG: Methionine aminopeptidase [Candidatus Anoxychlamydiales bacterium]|nr:Methionine aminopeptidase [Candidatus Anoxychlamydiales bacterium]